MDQYYNQKFWKYKNKIIDEDTVSVKLKKIKKYYKIKTAALKTVVHIPSLCPSAD